MLIPALLDDMAGIKSTQLTGIVVSTLISVGIGVRALLAWIISAFDQGAELFFATTGKNPAGMVYVFSPTKNPATWVNSPRRSTVIAERTLF